MSGKAGTRHRADYEALAAGRHDDPFAVLGPHREAGRRIVRAFDPAAAAMWLVDTRGEPLAEMARVHADGIYEVTMPARKRRYRLRSIDADGTERDREDPYRFGTTVGDVDRHLLAEGTHRELYRLLGATVTTVDGIDGTRFSVWAPNASRVSVVGEFNRWDGRCHPMRRHPANGLWELFVPGTGPGTLYKYELLDAAGNRLPLKADPVARYSEQAPGFASIVYQSQYDWNDDAYRRKRGNGPHLDQPVSIYEVHLGSWRRHGDDGRWLSYRELADSLVPYVESMGFTHIELLPVNEHPFDGSWGYQPIGLFAPTSRFGEPDDLRYFVDRAHQAGIAVIVDWVPAHFPKDEHGLRRFDGTALYEHEDPRKGEHTDWGTLIYNYGRAEVSNFLIASALYWLSEFHIDALRVDAVASMLYLDYSRDDGEWIPNEFGGNENLDAVAFLRRLNEDVHAIGGETFAEESTAWPGVSRPTDSGGLGFTYKWNMGWMHDTLAYIREDPIHRRYHHDKMTFGLVYAFNENFVLPLSHDEVVHGKRSILGRMPGDDWQRFANLRAYYGAMFLHPGKKLLFMGAEIAQYAEWNHDKSLDWHLTDYDSHRGVQRLVRDLNEAYRATPAMHEIDFDADGFEWIDWQDAESSLLSWIRRDRRGGFVLAITNFTPVIRHDYRLGVPAPGRYRERLNTDDTRYGGTGTGNRGELVAGAPGAHGREQAITLTLPPLATLIIEPAG